MPSSADSIILLYSSELLKNKDFLTDKRGTKIISCSSDISFQLKKQNVSFISIENYFSIPYRISHITREWMNRWVYHSVGQNYLFLDTFSTEIAHMWWFIDIALYFQFIEIIKTILEISRVIELESPKEIRLLDKNTIRIQVVRKVCTLKGINFKLGERKYISLARNMKTTTRQVLANWWRPIKNRLIRRWSIHKQKELDKAYNYLISNEFARKGIFLTHPMHWRSSVDPSKEGVKENYYFSLIYEKIQSIGIQPIDVHIVRKIKESSKVIDEIVTSQKGIPLKILQSYYPRQSIKANSTIKIIKRRLEEIFKDQQFVEKIRYNGVPLQKIVYPSIIKFLHRNVPYVTLTIENANEMIIKEKPDFIFLINEYSLHERATIIAAKKLGITCYALQHGLISSEHPGYVIRSETTPELNIELPPRVDKTFLYGKNFAKILINLGNYSLNQISVVGNPIWDKIKEMTDHYDPRAIKRNLKIPANRKVILHTTENLPDGSNPEVTSNIINTFQKMEKGKYFLLIKVHPNEQIELYRSLVPVEQDDILVIKDVALGELLTVSDVLITVYSTTVFDAVVSNVPAITVSFSHSLINSFFYDSDISYKADKENLGSTIESILEKEKLNQFIKDRERIINNYANGLDAKALERIIEILIVND